ncbi:MAG: universal stress protein [Tannerellaceae bacterium]|jgi:nucleotide-binding universal stress UspA family protein|nr:universal stress protein [Tannerellaceae bacterium]
MEEKLITLAIHTYEKAQILKTILETEGIAACIHNVNLIQPVISAGVRVRIKESDLAHALSIIEDNKWLEETHEEMAEKRENKVLVPVDFSEYSMKACEIGINYAHATGAKVILLHAYFSPFFPKPIPFGDMPAYGTDESKTIRELINKVEDDMAKLCLKIRRKMDAGELPRVKFESILREGLPEEELIACEKQYYPKLIVMGARGKGEQDIDLLGSVTAEIIELAKAPVLAIPENVPFNNISATTNIAFATSFNQRDLVAFEAFVGLIGAYTPKIHLFNISNSRSHWDEIRLGGIKEYFKKQYPNLNISHTVLDDCEILAAIEKFVREENIEIIAVTSQKRNILTRIFYPGIARKMLFHSDTPLLVLHS